MTRRRAALALAALAAGLAAFQGLGRAAGDPLDLDPVALCRSLEADVFSTMAEIEAQTVAGDPERSGEAVGRAVVEAVGQECPNVADELVRWATWRASTLGPGQTLEA